MIATLASGAALIAEWRQDAALIAAIRKLPELLSGQDKPPPDSLVARVAAASSAFVLGRGAGPFRSAAYLYDHSTGQVATA